MHLLIDEILFRLARAKRAARGWVSGLVGGRGRAAPRREAPRDERPAWPREDVVDDPIEVGYRIDSWGETPESLGEIPRVPDEAWEGGRGEARGGSRRGSGSARRGAAREPAERIGGASRRPSSEPADPLGQRRPAAPERSAVSVSPLRAGASQGARRPPELPAWAVAADRAAGAELPRGADRGDGALSGRRLARPALVDLALRPRPGADDDRRRRLGRDRGRDRDLGGSALRSL